MSNKETNVLLTSAGRRNYLLGAFVAALGASGRVFAADCREDAPVLQEAARGFLVPPVNHPEYVDCLLELCRVHGVSLVVPLNDLELPVLAPERDRFARLGTTVLVPSPTVVSICTDKWETAQFLSRQGLDGPQTFLETGPALEAVRSGQIRFPLFLKPRWGSASSGIERVEDSAELELAFHLARKRLRRNGATVEDAPGVLIQEALQGEEYGLDVVNSLRGEHCVTFARKKLGMRAGETERALTVRSAVLEEVGRRIGGEMRHSGMMDCDVFLEGDRCRILEFNPRFGGGYPFVHAAGADLPAFYIAQVRGEVGNPDWLRPRQGVVAAKCDRVVTVRRPAQVVSMQRAVQAACSLYSPRGKRKWVSETVLGGSSPE
jgi:carbamoyl-phosphate synthase large subunit